MAKKAVGGRSGLAQKGAAKPPQKRSGPSAAQLRWLKRGADQPGRKLPLFDEEGRAIPARTIRACIAAGWAEPWFSNPIKPDWLVCKLTDLGLDAIGDPPGSGKS